MPRIPLISRVTGARRAAIAALVVALTTALLLAGQSTGLAEPQRGVDIAYLSVTGEGPTAKAWYDGAPSPGVSVQDALNAFAKEGYTVVEVTQSLRVNADPVAFVILLQRVR